jgi:outer membrane protein TolC
MKKRCRLALGALGMLWPAVVLAQAPAAAEAPKLELRDAPKSTMATEDPLSPRPGGLTSEIVAKKAVAASPSIAGRQAEIDAANAKVDQAMLQFFPRLTLTASYVRTSPAKMELGGGGAMVATPGVLGPTVPAPAVTQACNGVAAAGGGCVTTTDGATLPLIPFQLTIPSVVDNYSLSATLGVPISDYVLRLSKTMAATRANERASQLNKQAEELKVATDARIAYYNWVRGVAATTVAESALVRIKALQKDTEAAFTVGVATKADVLRVDSLSASTELTITETQNFKQITAEQLALLMSEPSRDYQVGENVRAAPPPAGQEAPLPALVAESHRRRLELRALAEADQSLTKAAGVVRMGGYPRLDGFAEFDYARPNRNYAFDPTTWHHNWMLGLSLSYTFNDSFSNQASARELDANRRKLQYDVESLKRGLQMEVTSAFLDQKKARVALDTAQRGLRSAQEAYRVALDLYRVGRATTTELIASEQELLAAALREVNATIDFRLAAIRLAHATGRDVPGG